MAQLNITLNQEEILQLLSVDHDEAFKKIFTESLNSLLKVESQEQLNAAPYERTQERTDSRNGYRDRELKTRIGTITLHVPRHREQPFKTMIFENYSRSEAALIASMAEMVVNGVSTRKVSQIMETLCGTSYSKSAVSDLCRELDNEVTRFRERPLEGGYPFVTVDATYFKTRESHRIVSKAFMIAYGTKCDGHREILGFSIYHNETTDTWTDFLSSLKKRGLRDILMITSDAHEGIRRAISNVFPGTAWQRCQFHFSRNISGKTPPKYQAGISSELTEMFNAKNMDEAIKKRDSIIADYREIAETAVECLEEGFDSAMTVMMLPKALYRQYRTSNHIERLNRELKRRSKVIGVFANCESIIRLMGSVLIEFNEKLITGKRIFSEDTYKRIVSSDLPEKLKVTAMEQQKLQKA